MGYRNYIFRIKKDVYERIRHFTKSQLLKDMKGEDTDYLCPLQITDEYCKEVEELGKYVDSRFRPKGMTPFFNRPSVEDEINSEYELKIMTREDFLNIIDEYHKAVQEHLEKLLKDDDDNVPEYRRKSAEQKCKGEVFSELSWWRSTCQNLDTSDSISTSWLYKHNVFNLAHKYKMLQEDDILVWAGW